MLLVGSAVDSLVYITSAIVLKHQKIVTNIDVKNYDTKDILNSKTIIFTNKNKITFLKNTTYLFKDFILFKNDESYNLKKYNPKNNEIFVLYKYKKEYNCDIIVIKGNLTIFF